MHMKLTTDCLVYCVVSNQSTQLGVVVCPKHSRIIISLSAMCMTLCSRERMRKDLIHDSPVGLADLAEIDDGLRVDNIVLCLHLCFDSSLCCEAP